MASYIKSIFALITGEANFTGGALSMTPENFNSTLFDFVSNIQVKVIMPIAYVILSLFALLELYNITVRNTDSTRSFEIPFKLMFKVVICKLVIDNSSKIVNAIYMLSNEIIKGIESLGGSAASVKIAENTADIDSLVNSMSFGEQCMVACVVTLAYVLYQILIVYVTVQISARMIEIYIYLAVTPLPLSTFANADMSNIAKNFLKSFAAVCLQGVFMFLVLSFFNKCSMSQAVVGGATGSWVSMITALFAVIGDIAILVLAIGHTGKWSKMICNAM